MRKSFHTNKIRLIKVKQLSYIGLDSGDEKATDVNRDVHNDQVKEK